MPDLDEYKRWTPQAQEKALQALRDSAASNWRPFYCPNRRCNGKPHGDWAWNHARVDQRPPAGRDWLVWLIMGGRGSGKTRTGAEWTRRKTLDNPRIALIAPTGPDARDIMVEGESGILATSPPDEYPEWEPSKKQITWPNGAKAHVFSGEEPDRLRGPQHYCAWIDEPAHTDLIEQVWANLLFGLRLGTHPQICATTTPAPVPWMKELVASPDTRLVNPSTYDNLDNLAPVYRKIILSKYEGTRLGKQEIHGELLSDVEGSLWKYAIIEQERVSKAPALDRVVVSIDPAGTANKTSDETGIVVIGIAGEHLYMLADASGRYSPEGWSSRAIGLVDTYDADAIVAEKNYGGDMVRSVLTNSVGPGEVVPRIIEVTSRRGKLIRAEPIYALYERRLVHHVGPTADLDEQMCSWVPGASSPDRLDALVHGATELAKVAMPSTVASPNEVLRNFQHHRHLRSVS